MPDVVLIRPGCTDFDEQHRIQGSLDLPLSRRGQEQVELVVRQLRGANLDVVFSAPCEPARATAIAVCGECGATFKEMAEFRNLNHGLWQGLQVDDARRKYPKVFKQWHESPETVCLPEGETVAKAVERIERGLRKCLKRKRNVGIVASEPLATLIGCVLRGCRPELPDAAAYSQPERRVEFLHLSEEEGARAILMSATAIGSDTNDIDTKDIDTNDKKGKRDRGGQNGQKKTNGTPAAGRKEPLGENGRSGRRNGAEGGQPAGPNSAPLPKTVPRRAPE